MQDEHDEMTDESQEQEDLSFIASDDKENGAQENYDTPQLHRLNATRKRGP